MSTVQNITQITVAPATTLGALEFLAFTLGQEEYAIDIQKVQELRGYV